MKNNILMIFRRFYPHVWWVESQWELLCEEFQKKWYSIDIITFKYDKGLDNYEQYNWINIYRFNNYFWFIYLIIKLIHDKKYNFIMSHQILQETLIVWILKFIKIIKIPTIWLYHSWWENSEIMKIVKTFNFLKLYKLIYYFIFQLDYLNCLNNSNKEQLQKYIIWNNKKLLNKLIFIPNWIKLSGDFWKYPKKENIKNLLFLWRFEREKWIIETIDAFKKIKNDDLILNIVWYWDDDVTNEVLESIRNDSRIKFLWKKTWKEKENIFKNTDLFVFPSYYSEWQSITLMEASFYNIPIITTKVWNNFELYWNNLIYVKEKDVNDLKEKIEFVIENINNINYDYNSILINIDISNIVNKYDNLFKIKK